MLTLPGRHTHVRRRRIPPRDRPYNAVLTFPGSIASLTRPSASRATFACAIRKSLSWAARFYIPPRMEPFGPGTAKVVGLPEACSCISCKITGFHRCLLMPGVSPQNVRYSKSTIPSFNYSKTRNRFTPDYKPLPLGRGS